MAFTLIGLMASPAAGADSDAGDAGLNFNESAECGSGIAGPNRPQATRSGTLPTNEIVYGPWGDFFGRNRAQIEGSLARWPIPFSTGGHSALVHERLLPALLKVTAALDAAAAAGRVYPIGRFFSGWSWRTVGGATYLSNHAVGNAIDLNTIDNPYRSDNTLITDMPAWFVDAWTAAGFCWGGFWGRIKDPMHFSWMGPRATAGYGPVPAPYPPLTAAAPWTLRAFGGATSQPPLAGDVVAFADRSRDGAPDLYRVTAHDGVWRVEAAGARSGFSLTGYRVDTAAPAGSGTVLLGDYDGSARADLWVVDRGLPTTITIYTDTEHFEAPAATFTVPIDTTGAELALADYNRDLSLDLFAFTGSSSTRVQVWDGAAGFAVELLDAPAWFGGSSGAELLLGDHDVDGIPDLYLITRATPAVVRVASGAGGYQSGGTVAAPSGIAAAGAVHLGIEDYDGDGRDDFYVVTGPRVDVYLGGARDPGEDFTAWFLPDDALPWDAGPECVGPEPCDQIGFMTAAARWHVRDEIAAEAGDVEYLFGNPGDAPLLGDWDCDGVATPGLYRRSDGFVYLRNGNSTGIADRSFFFGNPGDIPLAGDFDGDGCDTVSLYRPREGRVYVVNGLGNGSSGLGAADLFFDFGDPGDQPFVGDFDGDGSDEVGLHRASTGLVYYRTSLTTGPATASFVYGDPGDRLVAGDWDGDGVDTVAVFRPSDGNWYIKLDTRSGVADHVVHYHTHDSSDTFPVAGRAGTSSR